MCTITAKDDHRKQAGVRPRRRLLAGSRPDPGPASGPGASRTAEGRRRLGQRYLPSGRRVGCPYTSSRGDGDIDRARATVAASIVMAIAHTRASASSCRRSQPQVRLGLVDRPMASRQESAACGLAGPSSSGRGIGAFSSRAPSARTVGRPAQPAGEAYRSKRELLQCANMSISSTASWTDLPCSACGTARYRRRRGLDLRCGSTEIFIRATC